jgi:uncharacterized membrane protein
MRHFFTEDASSSNRSTIEIQERAVWIAVALILISLNDLIYGWLSLLGLLGAVLPVVLTLASFAAMWRAFRPTLTRQSAEASDNSTTSSSSSPSRYQPKLWQRIILVLTLILSLAGIVEFGMSTIMCFLPPIFSNDGTSLDTNAAMLLIHGRNPYTDSNMLDMYRKFKLEPNWTTPLREGQFANRLDYPGIGEFRSVLDTALKSDGVAPEFESKVSYPALSFLTLVPFALFNNYNVLPLYLLSHLVLIFIAWKVSKPALRPWVLLLAAANVPMWSSTVGGNLDIFYTLLIVLAWMLRDSRWRSALLLGLAIASKQIAWFFVPFYIIMVFRHYGWKETFYRMVIAGTLGLGINLPFILWNPHAWLQGVLAPVADPMFPMGVGIISLSIGHLIPYLPSAVYTVLEAGAMLGCLLLYWRVCRKYPELAMVLAVFPLIFAWRSLPSYFACVAYPLFILTTSHIKPNMGKALAPATASLRRTQYPLKLALPIKASASI